MVGSFEFKIIKNDDLTVDQIKDIITIKALVWKYTEESHIEWLRNNIKSGDYHLLIYENSICIAYLNLVDLVLTTQKEILVWGIGNVCVNPVFQGRNIGFLMMRIVEYFLSSTKRIGVLICRDKVSGFYERSHWQKFRGEVIDPDGRGLMSNFYFSEETPECYLNKDLIKINRIFR